MTSCEEELAAYVNTLRAYQFHARYPMLLLRDHFGADVLRWKRHTKIGLISVAVRHGDLDAGSGAR